MQFDFKKSRQYLQAFAFGDLFREVLGWSKPTVRKAEELEIEGQLYDRQMIAELSGVAVYEVTAHDGAIAVEKVRKQIYQQTAEISLENLLIFVDRDRTQSFWYWVKREDKKRIGRSLSYFAGQSGDLILGKISALMVDFEELGDEAPSVVAVAKKLKDALDVERVTKKFYKEFKEHLEWFVEQIKGIDHENDRRWYASVILNRLMFVYFLQDKGFVDGNPNYLQDKLAQHQGKDYYKAFLCVLFFEGFAKAAPNRSEPTNLLLGNIKYLNGGLFLQHRIEKDNTISSSHPQGIAIANEAFEKTLALFERYSWNLDDTPGGQDDEISPSVLGYIFEKYINQKEFGAYYTRPEITEYLCDRTINKLILDKVNAESKRRFESIEELLFNLDTDLCIRLLETILPGLSLLDPACGSGAFLVAAMKTLINIYSAVIGKVELSNDRTLKSWLKKVRDEHKSTAYYIKKRIITDNLYGVDIMEEATEIAKLRLFLALVASAQSLDELEPLPNIDFNVMAGNSLIGLIRVDEDGFNELDGMAIEPTQRNLLKPTAIQGSLLPMLAANEYRRILDEKNKSIALFKQQAFRADDSTEPEIRTDMLKASIDELNGKSQIKLNRLLFDEFGRLKIKFEQAQATGKPTKRLLEMKDIDRLEPFHWGYHFDQIINERGGFDAIIANPPWEVFKPDAKEFFQKYSDLVTKKKMDIKAFEKHQTELLEDPEVAAAWLQYQSQFPYVNLYYRTSDNYRNQISVIDGKKAKSTDINLYKLFLERCFSLLKPSGECGIVIPSGLYTDLGSKQLREMLFSKTRITGLFCFENRKTIFEGVDSRFKFIVLSFCKGDRTESFPAAFMRHDVRELTDFPNLNSLQISVDLIRRLSPDSLSIMEFKNSVDVQIAEKTLQFPLLGDQIPDRWNLILGREFHMTDDKNLFQSESIEGRLPLYEGKMIHQFTHTFSQPKYWIDEIEGRKAFLSRRKEDCGQELNYQKYRFAYRAIGRSTDSRTLIGTILPKNTFSGHSINVGSSIEDLSHVLYLCAVLNSFCFDFALRQQVSANLTIFFIHQTPVPRLTTGDRFFAEIVERAAKLICTTPEFDDLAQEVGLDSHKNGITDERDRAQLRAQLDGMIAHLYHLTESEFAHILSTFPIVPAATKQAAIEAYRTFAPPAGDTAIATLITQGESATLEFKSTARWNLKEDKKDRTMEEVILKTIAAFLNTQGGTLLIGVDDAGDPIGLTPDYNTLQKKNRDGFELWLMGDLLLKELGNDLAPLHCHQLPHPQRARPLQKSPSALSMSRDPPQESLSSAQARPKTTNPVNRKTSKNFFIRAGKLNQCFTKNPSTNPARSATTSNNCLVILQLHSERHWQNRIRVIKPPI